MHPIVKTDAGKNASITRSFLRAKPIHPDRPAVLHLIKDLKFGESAREVVDLCIQTHRSGWRSLLASAGGDLVLEAERAAVRHCKVNLTRSFLGRWLSRIKLDGWIQKEKPSLIHVHGFESIRFGLDLSIKFGLPLLIDLTEPVSVTPYRQKLLKKACQKGAFFRVPSDYMARHLRQDFQITSPDLYKIFPGVDLRWFDSSRVTAERLQSLSKVWRLPEQAIVLVMGTPLSSGFGQDVLLDALAEADLKDVYTVFIGDDGGKSVYRKSLEKQIQALKLEGRVIISDQCHDWPAACWLSSLVLATNALPRGQARELLGAQALGRPIILTDCGANAEMAKAGETAWLVKQGDKKALAQALREAVQMTGAQRISLANATRSYARLFFPSEFYRDSMFELYGSMLSLHEGMKSMILSKAA